jgi:ribosomal 50S subunit-associated protein YjgA (DUF615 family)
MAFSGKTERHRERMWQTVNGVAIMSFYPELDGKNLHELIALFMGSAPEDEIDVFYLEVADRIKAFGDEGTSFLNSYIPDADTQQLRAIIFALGDADYQQFKPYIVSCLNREEPILDCRGN